MATPAECPTDGRIQRSERSREAIVRAILELIAEGDPTPTAQQVAARADVGVRTVFRHFSDMETLFATMHERLATEIDPFFVAGPQSGSIEERIEGLVEKRIALFEKLAPYLRSAALQKRSSAFLAAQHERNVRALRRDLLRWLPEVEALSREAAEGLEMSLSFEAFDRLRSEQRLGTRRTCAVFRRLARALLDHEQD